MYTRPRLPLTEHIRSPTSRRALLDRQPNLVTEQVARSTSVCTSLTSKSCATFTPTAGTEGGVINSPFKTSLNLNPVSELAIYRYDATVRPRPIKYLAQARPANAPFNNNNNNNNEYLQCLTHAGCERLHVLYKYILSKFNAYNMNAHTHMHAHIQAHTRTRAHVCVCVYARMCTLNSDFEI